MRGTMNVVTSLCADGMTGILPTSTPESKVCKALLAGQSARTTTGNSKSRPARGYEIVGAACETTVSQKSGAFNDKNLPSSASGVEIVSTGVLSGRLRQNTASSEKETRQVVCLIALCSEVASRRN